MKEPQLFFFRRKEISIIMVRLYRILPVCSQSPLKFAQLPPHFAGLESISFCIHEMYISITVYASHGDIEIWTWKMRQFQSHWLSSRYKNSQVTKIQNIGFPSYSSQMYTKFLSDIVPDNKVSMFTIYPS
jgi:hypothetical protein